MIKRNISLILSSLLIITMVGCSSKDDNAESREVSPMEAEIQEVLPGEWSSDFTREEVLALNQQILERVEFTAANYGLEYEISEEVKEANNGTTIKDDHINIDIEDPEPNRLESVYYGFKQFGTDLASGQLVMKMSSVVDRDEITEAGVYDFGGTSFAAFSEAFTGVTERDYEELNQQIYDMIIGNESVVTIENNLNGVKETISVTDNILLYTLQTKEYSFK